MASLEEAAAEGKGHRNLPAIVRQQLDEWRQRVGRGGGAPEAVAAGADAPPAASSGSGGGSRIMI